MEVINMPRGPRLLISDICYHIIQRGNQKQNVFRENADFERYLQILLHYKKKYGFKLYAYCIMPNHIHLIVEAKKVNDLAKIMQGVSLTYTLWFNKKYGKVGHLWQGRFKSMVIQKDRYLIDCVNYIEYNPLRANLTKSPLDYLWSSWKHRSLNAKSSILDPLPKL
jgi:putative transposase